jgi:hypothetical protein
MRPRRVDELIAQTAQNEALGGVQPFITEYMQYELPRMMRGHVWTSNPPVADLEVSD